MDDVVVKVREGRLRGGPADYGYRFLRIPYARGLAETGRLAAPEPAMSWDGVRDANAFGATALQVLQAASSPANKDVTLMVGTTAHEFKMGPFGRENGRVVGTRRRSSLRLRPPRG